MSKEQEIAQAEKLAEWLSAAFSNCPRGQRLGQAAFNRLQEARPDLAEMVRGTAVDPFHSNRNIPQFVQFVAANWDGKVAQ